MFSLNCKGRFHFADMPLVMGIINLTPDSFFAGSRLQDAEAIAERAGRMIEEGADIIDLGGQSTRPGSSRVSMEEELRRVVAPIGYLRQRFPGVLLSVDTFYARVAAEAVQAGASLVNDISAGLIDPELLTVVGSLGVPYVLMHMKGSPADMQVQPVYDDVVAEMLDFFTERMDACRQAGIHDVIIDPGFGFGKTIGHNFEILGKLEIFGILNRPLLAGLSRKSTIYKTLGQSADESLNGTTVLNSLALLKRAAILRVHDVKEAREAVRLVTALREYSREAEQNVPK